MRRGLVAGVLGALMASAAAAQTAVSVDIGRASLSWTAGVGGGTVATYNVKCGTATGLYTLPVVHVTPPSTSVALKAVVPGPATYFCVVSASNQFGESGNSNEVNFSAGNSPAAPTTFQLIAQ